jgi:hypothetical protein
MTDAEIRELAERIRSRKSRKGSKRAALAMRVSKDATRIFHRAHMCRRTRVRMVPT